ncbi:hypothetical protein ABEU97_20250 [Priestia megaterium]
MMNIGYAMKMVFKDLGNVEQYKKEIIHVLENPETYPAWQGILKDNGITLDKLK